ncbi:hypothetical protein NRC85_003760 [Vibrio parahaemolyticus]|nr:hypothetical protein [Vibrio parahaemolyticus]
MNIKSVLYSSLLLIMLFPSLTYAYADHTTSRYGPSRPALCKMERFNAFNYFLDDTEQLTELPVGMGEQLFIDDNGDLLRCPDNYSVELNTGDKVKCAENTNRFKRNWTAPEKLQRGEHYDSALYLLHCKSIVIKTFRF